MAKYPSKGVVFNVEIASTMTAVAQIIELDVGSQDPESFECRTLDGGAGVGYDPTGYVMQGDVTGTFFYDPGAATHQFIASRSQAPGTKTDCEIDLTDAGPTTLTFTAATIGLNGLAVRMNDGLKSGFTCKPDGLVTFPTS